MKSSHFSKLFRQGVFLPTLASISTAVVLRSPDESELEKLKTKVSYKREQFPPYSITTNRFDYPRNSKLISILDKNTKTQNLNQNGVESYSTTFYNANCPIEDTSESSHGPFGHLFGVFDGHSGKAASLFCKNELFKFLHYFLKNTNINGNLLNEDAFIFADDCFLDLAVRQKRFSEAAAGACAVVTHIDENKMRIANTGDCRCVVGEITEGEDIHFKAIELTKDHQMSNELERERLLKNHLCEWNIIKRDRVKGRLQPTRGFGDGVYKRKEIYNALKANSTDYWDPPYTNSYPDITEHVITPKTRFVVLATDGVFDELSSQQVVDCVGEYLTNKKSSPDLKRRNASSFLIERALSVAAEREFGRQKMGQQVNILMSVKEGNERRKLHDDMTATVILLDSNLKKRDKDLKKFYEKNKLVPDTVIKLQKILNEEEK